jgi:hypothetical protein
MQLGVASGAASTVTPRPPESHSMAVAPPTAPAHRALSCVPAVQA